MNALLGQKVAIVSPRPQTTRRNLLGILTEPEYQIAFVDTPGISLPKHLLGSRMVEAARHALEVSDVVLFVTDVARLPGEFDWRVARMLQKVDVPKVLVLNKMDRLGADFFDVVDKIRARLGSNAVPIQVPIGAEASYCGYVDLVTRTAHYHLDEEGLEIEVREVGEEMADTVEAWRENLLEALAELDDHIMEKYLAGENIPESEIKAVIRKATLESELVVGQKYPLVARVAVGCYEPL